MRRNLLTPIALFVLTVMALVLPAYALIRVNEIQLDLACLNAETNVRTLEAIQQNGIILRRIAFELGLPVAFPPLFEIPEVPSECDM